MHNAEEIGDTGVPPRAERLKNNENVMFQLISCSWPTCFHHAMQTLLSVTLSDPNCSPKLSPTV